MQKSYIAILVVFVALFTYPFYSNLGKAGAIPEPDLKTPEIEALTIRECVLPKEEMRGGHMQILDDWRNEVVRDGNRKEVSIAGKKWQKSLQKTCLNCHSNQKKFCDKCHEYLAVKPYCWDCHFSPKKKETDV